MHWFTALRTLVRHPRPALKGALLAQQEQQAKATLQARYGFDQLPTVDLLELFPGFTETLSTYSFLEGTSLITDLMLLKQLARGYPACNYLEIGSWRGESLANVSEVAQACTSITLSPDEMRSMGLDPAFIDVHGIFSRQATNVTEILHNSRTFDFSSLAPTFDLIFIDGDHSYEGVLNDTSKTLGLRRGPRPAIVWHDYGFGPESVRYTVLQAILDGIPRDHHKHLFHVSNTMCAVYLEERTVATYRTIFPTVPNKRFTVSVSAEPL